MRLQTQKSLGVFARPSQIKVCLGSLLCNAVANSGGAGNVVAMALQIEACLGMLFVQW